MKIQKERQAKKAAAGELEPKNKERFYCTSAEMHAELVKWRDSNKEEEQARIKKNLPIDYTKRKLSEEFGRMLMAIAVCVNRDGRNNVAKTFVAVICVAGFILMGGEHCIADIGYMMLGKYISTSALVKMAFIIAGNVIGSILVGELKGRD